MCGIFGQLSSNSINLNNAKRAHELQSHRGPDSQGEVISQLYDWNILLAHQRLSIIDLEGGSQPSEHKNSGNILIFNGEIYNFIEIGAELKKNSIICNYNSDTDVLHAALNFWGIEKTVQKLNGMWAFAWLEKSKQLLHLSRDRCGEKPLFYFTKQDELYFASEIKTILNLAEQRFNLNRQFVSSFVQLGLLDTSTNSIFEDINSIKPGSILTVNLSHKKLKISETIYWAPSTEIISEHSSFNDFLQKFREIFLDSVRIRMRSDVSVGLLLSGGMDSSAIAAAVKELGAEANLKFFSFTDRNKEYDESSFVKDVSNFLEVETEFIQLPESNINLIEDWMDATKSLDSPIPDLSCVAHYKIMSVAKDLQTTVLLSGQGGDELLCGYRKYLGFYSQYLLRNKQILSMIRLLSQFTLNRSIINQFNFAEGYRYIKKIFPSIIKDPMHISRNILSEDIPYAGLLQGETLRDRQLRDIQYLSVPSICRSEDAMSMAFSREIRLPFLDHRLIELMLTSQDNYKLSRGWTKYCLRKAFDKQLPNNITWRKDKQGFSNNGPQLIRTNLKEFLLDDIFSPNSYIFEKGIYNRRYLIDHYKKYCQLKSSNSLIWSGDFQTAMGLEIFLRGYHSYL